jgi:hypothetical protein
LDDVSATECAPVTPVLPVCWNAAAGWAAINIVNIAAAAKPVRQTRLNMIPSSWHAGNLTPTM